jgi:hypothetical protein
LKTGSELIVVRQVLCVCSVSPLGHVITSVFLQVRSPGCLCSRAWKGRGGTLAYLAAYDVYHARVLG